MDIILSVIISWEGNTWTSFSILSLSSAQYIARFSVFGTKRATGLFRNGGLPHGVWLLKYLGTASVTVTFLTVMVFLGPTMGYKSQLEGWSFYLHVIGPLLAIISFCFLERIWPLSCVVALLGLLPVLLYGILYLYKVVITKQWEDFYGFNKNGKWKISFSAMVIGTFLVCILLWLLCRF